MEPIQDGVQRRPDSSLKPRLIDTQHRIKLPPEAMEVLKVKPGDYVAVILDSAGIHLKKVEWTVK